MSHKVKLMRRRKATIKELSHEEFFKLFREFIRSTERGIRTKRNGDNIKPSTIDGYQHCYRLLNDFCNSKNWQLKLHLVSKLNRMELRSAQAYWRNFYKQFTDYLYFDLNHFDNYVGHIIKCLRVFYNYLNDIVMINIGRFHLQFHVPKEDIEIVVLSPSQLHDLIKESLNCGDANNKEGIVRDIFILGCTLGLRFGDLLNLEQHNLILDSEGCHLAVQSQKTGVDTKVKLPFYAIEIFERFKTRKKRLLPKISKSYFNSNLKQLAKRIFGERAMVKTRCKRGIRQVITREGIKSQEFHINELVSSHCMRRTAITVMLRLGMSEASVRAISGHAPNSKEFYKYIAFCQTAQDEETDRMFAKLQNS